jgi:hypothetical protein
VTVHGRSALMYGLVCWCGARHGFLWRRARRSPRARRSFQGGGLWWGFGRLFDVPLEYCQHACLHGPDDRDIDPVVGEAFYPLGPGDLVTADHETSAAAGQLFQQEAPQAFGVGRWPWLLWVKSAASQVAQPVQAQVSVRFKRGHFPRVHRAGPCRVLHVVAEGEVLPLRVDLPGTWAAAVVEAVPGVPAPAVPPYLDQPRPRLDLAARRW